jgi:proteasome assembly chaperone 3
MASMAFPVKSAQTHAAIGGVPTDFHVSVYSDRVLVVITQNGKPGTLLHAQRERSAGGMGTGPGCFSIKVLLGKRDEYLQVYARHVAEMVAARCDKPVLLTLCVKDDSPEVFKSVMSSLATIAIW